MGKTMFNYSNSYGLSVNGIQFIRCSLDSHQGKRTVLNIGNKDCGKKSFHWF